MPAGNDGIYVRKSRRYPYTWAELVFAKLLALMHDPPWKSLAVTGSTDYMPPESGIRIRPHYWKNKKDKKKHEEAASRFAAHILGLLEEVLCPSNGPVVPSDDRARSALEHALAAVSRRADCTASGFDRIVMGDAELRYKECVLGEQNGSLKTGVKRGLFNPFDPRVEAASSGSPRGLLDALSTGFKMFREELKCRLSRMSSCPEPGYERESLLLAGYHVFSLLYEPLWHVATEGKTWGPADTRVPHHSVFDHLYASAMAVNLTSREGHKGIDGLNTVVGGYLVYVGWRGLGEWLRGSRKLGDLWVSSWLATAMAWYAVKELVWCLGPDVLVVPGFRWNQFYMSLLREKLGEDVFEASVGDVARRFYFWEGFPYYAWQPAEAIVVLPLVDSRSDLPQGCSFLEKIYDGVGSHPCFDDLLKVARRIEDYLRERLMEAWRQVVEAVAGKAREKFCGHMATVFEAIKNLVKDIPPLEPVVVVVPVWVGGPYKDDKRICVYIDGMDGPECISSREKGRVLCCKLLTCLGFSHSCDYLEDVCRGFEDAEKMNRMAQLLAKIVYALGFYRLMARVRSLRRAPGRVGWARLLVEQRDELMVLAEAAGRRAGRDAVWRSCSVCRRGVAVLHVPGRDLPGGGVSDDYKDFVMALCRSGECGGGEENCGHGLLDREWCWRVWRTVLRPGERLCSYCFVKRFAGLPEFFEEIAEALIGYKPGKEIRFPATDDVAALASRLAVLKLAAMTAAAAAGVSRDGVWPGLGSVDVEAAIALRKYANLDELGRVWENLARRVSGIPYRSKIHEEAARKLGELLDVKAVDMEEAEEYLTALRIMVERRWWTPWLLYRSIRDMAEAIERAVNTLRNKRNNEENDGEDDNNGKYSKLMRLVLVAGLSALLAVDLEFRDMLAEDKGIGAVLGNLGKLAYGAGRSLYYDCIGKREEKERRRCLEEKRPALRLLHDISDALRRPRLYYAVVKFDVDSGGWLRLGLLPRRGNHGFLGAEGYLAGLLEAHRRVVERALARASDKKAMKRVLVACLGIEFLEEYLGPGGRGWSRDPLLALARASGSLLVTPSYHYTLSNTLGYTLLRSAIIAGRLGGISVYMAGDEGLVVLPAWMPWSLLPSGILGYRAEVVKAAELDGDTGELVAENPGLVYAVLLRRIYWASGSARPGFHPVKPGGAGKTLYRIPALVGAGLSMGLRYAHYRDHLYAELAAVEELVNEAKHSSGDRLAVSMGRLQPSRPSEALGAAVLLPLILDRESDAVETLRGAAKLPAIAAILAGAVAEDKASRSLLRGYELLLRGGAMAVAAAAEADTSGVLAQRIAAYLVERYTSDNKVATVLRSALAWAAEAGGWELAKSLLDTARITLEAMERGG